MNPFWDRFRFYSWSWESSQTSVALRNDSSRALAALSLPGGRTEKDAHCRDFYLSLIFPIFTIVAEKILTRIKLYKREMCYSKETEKRVATGAIYCP